jgi:Tfp pilus assembly protein PilF
MAGTPRATGTCTDEPRCLAPLPARAAHALAYLLAALQHNAEAETAFRRVVELAPRNSTVWFNLGFLCE